MANLKAVVNISASGTVGGSNLSGTNTGDQDLSHLAITGSSVIFANITASGNISASGTTSTSQVIIPSNVDAVKITGFTALGNSEEQLNIGKDSNWTSIEYGRGDTSKHEFLGHITASGGISSSGEVTANTIVVGSTITHANDSNTKITFSNDDINLTAAGKTAIDITYDGDGGGDTREITFNEGHADIDVRIEGDTDANLFFTDAGNEKVGIGTNSPGEKLEIVGNISASGTITALSSNIVTIDGGSF